MLGLQDQELRFVAVIGLTHFTQHFMMRLVPPLIPILAVALGYPLWQLGLLVSIYSLGGGLAQTPMGILSDRYDRVYLLPTGIALAGASYVLFAGAPVVGAVVPSVSLLSATFDGGFVVMTVAMVGVGVGMAVVHPAGYPLISANVDTDNKGKAMGAFTSLAKIGGATAPVAVGVLILVLGWEQIVLSLGLAGVVIGVGLYLLFRRDEFDTEPGGHEESVEAEADGDSGENGVAADNRTYRYPMVVMFAFLVMRKIATNGLTTFGPTFVIGVYAYSLEVQGVSFNPESVANFYFAALLLAGAASQIVLGGITDRYDGRTVMLGCLGVGLVSFLALATLDLSPLWLLMVLVAVGTGLWGLTPARDTFLSDISPAEREGRTFGYLWTGIQLTGVVIPVVVGYVFEAVGFREGFLILAVGIVLAFVAVSLLFSDQVYVSNAESGSTVGAGTSD